jgi:indole-3-glycerol phosphate synthase
VILDRIVAAKRAAHARRPPVAWDALERRAAACEPVRQFAAGLRAPGLRPSVIAEFKRRSPSAGAIRPDGDPAAIAAGYARAGAACLSILTDEEFFDGAPEHLARARAAAPVPHLRKDFLLDERDVLESRPMGADAVLLIARILPGPRLGALLATARAAGLDALVEVHGEAEADAALAAGATLVGVNHRDLDTLAIDLSLSARLRPRVPGLLVGESGVHTRDDVARLRDAGVDAILVGEALMRAPSPAAALVSLCS